MELVVHGEKALHLVLAIAADDAAHLVQELLQHPAVLLIILGAGQAHDAGLHHLAQLHQVVKGVLVQDHAIDHGVDHALLKAAANEGPLGALALQHAQIGENFDGLPHGAAGHAHGGGQLRLRRNAVSGLELLIAHGIGQAVDNALHHRLLLQIFHIAGGITHINRSFMGLLTL